MRLKGRKFWVKGVHYSIDVEEFRNGDGEMPVCGYIEHEGRRIVVDKWHQDDDTLAHELGHALSDQAGVYLSEYQLAVFEDFFAACRDPRNAWFLKYLSSDGG